MNRKPKPWYTHNNSKENRTTGEVKKKQERNKEKSAVNNEKRNNDKMIEKNKQNKPIILNPTKIYILADQTFSQEA